MTKVVTEQELQEKSVAPKVTPERIKELLTRVQLHFTFGETPTKYVRADAWLDGSFHLATVMSKAVNPENFSKELGIEYSTKDVLAIAENKLWELEGYRLFTNPDQPPKNHIERMQAEKHELDLKLNALKAFLAKLGTDNAPMLDDNQAYLLEEQAKHMNYYSNILGSRIEYDSELIGALG